MQCHAPLRSTVGRSSVKVVAFAPDKAASAKVKFTVKKKLHFGSSFAVVGSDPLSTWDPASPSALDLSWHEEDLWAGEANLPAGSPLEFKLVIKEPNGFEWQEGPNATVIIPEDASEIAIQTAWEDPTNVVMQPVSKASVTPAVISTTKEEKQAATNSVSSKQASIKVNGLGSSPESVALAAAGKLEDLTMPKLKALAVDCGVATSGKKADIIKRLRATQME